MSEKLIKEIKQKKPTLQELQKILKKHNVTERDEIHMLMLKHNLLKYIKKDKKFMSIKKKADQNVNNAYKELAGNPFKKELRSLKQKLKLQATKKTSKTTRKNKK